MAFPVILFSDFLEDEVLAFTCVALVLLYGFFTLSDKTLASVSVLRLDLLINLSCVTAIILESFSSDYVFLLSVLSDAIESLWHLLALLV